VNRQHYTTTARRHPLSLEAGGGTQLMSAGGPLPGCSAARPRSGERGRSPGTARVGVTSAAAVRLPARRDRAGPPAAWAAYPRCQADRQHYTTTTR